MICFIKEKEVLRFILPIVLHTVTGYPYEIKVSSIKSTSAALEWKSTELLVQEFSIHCAGSQRYITHDGEVHNTEMHMRSQYIPKGLTDVVIGDLRPNYNYSCVIDEKMEKGAQVFNGKVSDPVTFCTDVAAPTELEAPIITKEGGATYISVGQLVKDKTGPVTGYAVQFHLVTSPVLNDIPIEYDRTDPFGRLAPINIHYARVSQQPISFQILFKKSLPERIHIDHDLLKGALKNGAMYRVIVVPYVKSRASGILFTPSKPSVSFVAVGIDLDAFEPPPVQRIDNNLHIKIAVAAGILLPLLCLTYMCCIGAVLLSREHYLALKHDDDTERSCCGIFKRELAARYIYCLICWGQSCRYKKEGFEFLPFNDSEMAKDDKYFESTPISLHRKQHQSPFQLKNKRARVFHPHEMENMQREKAKRKRKQKVSIGVGGGSPSLKQKPHRHSSLGNQQVPTRVHRMNRQHPVTPDPVQDIEQDHDIESPLYKVNRGMGNRSVHSAQSRESLKQQQEMEGDHRALKDHRYKTHQRHYSEPKPRSKPYKHSNYYMHPDLCYSHGMIPAQHSHLQRDRTTVKQPKPIPCVPQKNYTRRADDLVNSRHSTGMHHKGTDRHSSHQSVDNSRHSTGMHHKGTDRHSSHQSVVNSRHSTGMHHKGTDRNSSHQSVVNSRHSTGMHHKGTDRHSSHQSTAKSPNHSLTVSASRNPNLKVSKLENRIVSSMILSETSGSTLLPEESCGQALEYTTSASIIEKPFNRNADEFFSLHDSDRHTEELPEPFTRSSDNFHSPLHHMPSKLSPAERPTRNASSTDGFDFVSLSSSVSQIDGKGLGHTLDILH